MADYYSPLAEEWTAHLPHNTTKPSDFGLYCKGVRSAEIEHVMQCGPHCTNPNAWHVREERDAYEAQAQAPQRLAETGTSVPSSSPGSSSGSVLDQLKDKYAKDNEEHKTGDTNGSVAGKRRPGARSQKQAEKKKKAYNMICVTRALLTGLLNATIFLLSQLDISYDFGTRHYGKFTLKPQGFDSK